MKLIAVVTPDTCTSAEQDDVVYHHCLLEENCGQKLPKKSVYFLHVVMEKDISEFNADQVGGEGLTGMQPHMVEDLLRWYTNELTNEGLERLVNEDNSEDEDVARNLLFKALAAAMNVQQALLDRGMASDPVWYRLHLDCTL